MLIELDKHSGVPIFKQVVDQISRQILTGMLAEGAQLVSVRELAEMLQVNPMTISKAYSRLEINKLVERKRGVGLFVAQPLNNTSRQFKRHYLEEMLSKAAIYAVQSNIEESEACELFTKLYSKYSGQKGNDNE